MTEQNRKLIMGQNLARLRKMHGLTQEQVAETLKIKRSTYAYYERNITPSLEVISKLAQLFNVSTHELMFGKPERAEKHGVLNDSTSVFDDSFDRSMYFTELTPAEKNLIVKFRVLPDALKRKLSDEIESILSKSEF